MQRGSLSIRKTEELPYHCFKEFVSEGSRKKSRVRKPVKTNEKVEIVYKVLIQHQFQKDVAKAHRVGQNTVSRLVKKTKKNKEFISELFD